MRGKGFLIIVLLGGIGGLGYRYLPSYYNPFAPLQLADPPGWITTFKLQRLTPSQCRELLTAANQQGLISSQPVADSAGECPLSHVVRVRDFGQVKLSSSFLASCPLALRSALFVEQQAKPLTETWMKRRLTRIEHLAAMPAVIFITARMRVAVNMPAQKRWMSAGFSYQMAEKSLFCAAGGVRRRGPGYALC